MTALARFLPGIAALGLAAACASIAGLEEPNPPRSDAATEAAPADGAADLPDREGPPAPASDAAEADGGAAPCTKQPNDAACGANEECCSGACSSEKKCVSKCAKKSETCLGVSCCAGLTCLPFPFCN